MAKRKKLAEAEWQVMRGVWSFARPVTVREVHSHLYPEGEKAYTTVQTIMNILVDKGFLQKEKIGMVNFYQPTVSRADFAESETHSLVARIFNGSFGALASYLVDSGELTPKDLHRLKALIEAKEKEGEDEPI
ncbi:MAG: BlaI/MecI/CopY family transcriptional regulator [bacterium]